MKESWNETHVDDNCKVRCPMVNPVAIDEFGEVQIANEHMHARISKIRVDENYVDVRFDEDNLIGDEWLHMLQ